MKYKNNVKLGNKGEKTKHKWQKKIANERQKKMVNGNVYISAIASSLHQ
jgi:hypothetical protein